MKRVHLVAARPLRYGTRRLRAGDTFDAAPGEARVYTAVGLASVCHKAPTQAAAVPALPPSIETPAPELDAARAEYEALAGRVPDRRWGLSRLKGELAMIRSQQESEGDAEEL